MSQALEGIRVIDFTHDQAGPSCTQMLAWLGADVIKIERPPHGDRARRLWATPDDPADSYFFLLLNSNKRSIVVDLKTVEGKDISRRLVREADVIAENLGPGVMERLGLGYEAVKVLNPRAVYASVKGFGSYGPYSAYKCFEPVAQATSGAMSVTGEAGGPPLLNGANSNDAVYLIIPPDNPEMFIAVTEVIGQAELQKDESFATPQARARNAAT